MCTVSLQLGGEEDSIFHSDGAMGERGDKELIPAWHVKYKNTTG